MIFFRPFDLGDSKKMLDESSCPCDKVLSNKGENMDQTQSLFNETALNIAKQMTRDVTIACMKLFKPIGENAKASAEKTYSVGNGGSVTVECHFDGLHVFIAWYKDNGEMITRETAIEAINTNLTRLFKKTD